MITTQKSRHDGHLYPSFTKVLIEQIIFDEIQRFVLVLIPRSRIVRALMTILLISPALGIETLLQQDAIPQDLGGAIRPGVVVEKVAHHGEAEKAGLQEGDVLLAWSRGDIRREIQSPFDLRATENQSLLGAVTLEGLRGRESKVWSLGHDNWELTTRPNFSGEFLASYREGQELVKTGEAAEVLRAVEGWKRLADRYSGSQTVWSRIWLLDHAADLLWEMRLWKAGDDVYQSAATYLQQSLAEIESSSSNVALAASLNGLGRISFERSDSLGAEQYYGQALKIGRKSNPQNLGVADSFMGLGSVADLDWAAEYYANALDIRERLAPGSLAVAASLIGLGNISLRRRDLKMAEQYYAQALEIEDKLEPGSGDIVATLQKLGLVRWQRKDFAKAHHCFTEALSLLQKIAPGSFDLVLSFNQLALLAYDWGELDKAEKYCQEAIAIGEKWVQQKNITPFLMFLAHLAEERGDLAKAEQYKHQALKAMEQPEPAQESMDAAHLDRLSQFFYQNGNLTEAEKYYRQAVAVIELKPRNTGASTSLADASVLMELEREQGDFRKAMERYRREEQEIQQHFSAFGAVDKEYPTFGFRLSISAPRELRQRMYRIYANLDAAEMFAASASIVQEYDANQRDQRDLKVLAQIYPEMISALERQTAHLGGSEKIRSDFGASHLEIYQGYADLLLGQKQPAQAFEVLERSRARVLLEMLVAAHVDIRKGADPSLLQQQGALEDSLTPKYDRRLQLLGEKSNEKLLATVDKEIEELERQYQEVQERLRLNSPVYAALEHPQALTVEEIQQLLDADSVLLEYSLREKHTYVFAVTRSSVEVYALPKQADIESAAKTVYDFFSYRIASVQGETRSQKLARERKAKAEYTHAAKLSQMILAPVAKQIQSKRLLIVSDGVLQYIPFAALPSPELSVGPGVPLIAKHEIVNLPSASILAVLRREVSTRKAAPKAVMVVADPVFDSHDDRLRGSLKTSEVSANLSEVTDQFSLGRSAREVGTARDSIFPRLPFSRREAEAIYATAKPGDATKALDFDASKATATSSQLGDYRIVHLATHGLVNSEHPELSGLVFSLFDRQGRQQDGFLRLSDIYNLELNAELVVLSACQTALGKQISGEGLIGMTRGFMYAGSPRVIASLWKVDDEATAELMKKFYEGVLKNGETAAEALRAAQMWMLKQPRWKAPYYWAGFILQGEWK